MDLQDKELKETLQSADETLKRNNEENAPKREHIPELDCVFHWLDCLYQDYLCGRRSRDEVMPCSVCPEVKNCVSCPFVNFAIAAREYGCDDSPWVPTCPKRPPRAL